jgi:hypothetical protein
VKLIDTDETILIVTGGGISAEERDRPLAYWLKNEIDRRGSGHRFRRAVVVSDAWYVENRVFHLNPAVMIGGPGVNLGAREFAEKLPIVVAEGEQAFVQSGDVHEVPKVCLWGIDASGTARAVRIFVERELLSGLLDRIWRLRPDVGEYA